MKKIIFLFIAFTSSIVFGQKYHEVKIDALEALTTPAVDISYEYAINDFGAVGSSIFLRLDEPETREFKKFMLSPYYRHHFYNNKSYGQKGFFIEGLLNYVSYKDQRQQDDTYGDFGIGFGGGVKLISGGGFTVDGHAALIRNFQADERSDDFIIRFGINFGFRFL